MTIPKPPLPEITLLKADRLRSVRPTVFTPPWIRTPSNALLMIVVLTMVVEPDSKTTPVRLF